jgi:hypothetical protein
MQECVDLRRQEAVVDEDIFLSAQRGVPAFQIARPIVFHPMTEDQILRASRSADRIGLNEPEPIDGAPERGGWKETARDGEAAQIVERRRHGGGRADRVARSGWRCRG